MMLAALINLQYRYCYLGNICDCDIKSQARKAFTQVASACLAGLRPLQFTRKHQQCLYGRRPGEGGLQKS